MSQEPRYLQRYDDGGRMLHWSVALLFFCAALSGLALFHPALYFFSALFGGGPWTRILHPYIGVLMALAFAVIAARLWRLNLIEQNDRDWLAHVGDVLKGDKDKTPPVGRYNGGQKVLFWLMVACLAVLFVTGFVFWRPWFAPYFPITLIRIAVLLHALAATLLILGVIVHIYAAIWVKGTLRAMTRGSVSEAWAKQNHPLWHREMTQGK